MSAPSRQADSDASAAGQQRAARPHPLTGPASQPASAGRLPGLLELLDRPLASYYLVLGITVLLLALGLVMVLSTTSAYALYYGGQPFASFSKQLLGAAAGLPLMWLLAKAPPSLFRAAAYPLMAISVVSLVLVLAVGQTVDGAERWIQVAGLQLQP